MSDELAGLRWWKSSRSGNQGGACVEVATVGPRWFVRDSKQPAGGTLVVSAEGWRRFVAGVRDGDLTD